MSVDSGHLWIAERLGAGPHIGSTRVDKFDASSGGFLPPQLGEEGEVRFLQTGVGVGHPGAEEAVYVGAGQEDQGVVAVFDPATGKLQHAWSGAGTLNKSFTQSEGSHVGPLTGVAVDGSALSETAGDVYVSTASGFIPSFNVVDVFKPEAGGEEPAKATAELRGTCAVEESTCPGEEVPFQEPRVAAVSAFNSEVLVSENRSVVDIFKPTLLGEYEFVRQLKGPPAGPFEQIAAVAVDGANGDIYVADRVAGVVYQFDAQGKYLGKLTGTPAGPFHSLQSVAVDPASEHVFIGDFNQERKTGAVDAFGKNIVLPDVTTTAPAPGDVRVELGASGEGEIEATLNGTVNPLGEGEATCRFAWGASGVPGQFAPCEPEGVPNGNAPVPVHSTIKELAPDTAYSFRLQATNKNGTNPGEEFQGFTTPGPGLHGESASEVSSSAATLNATIDPHGAPTSYYFQYGKSAAYEAQTPAAPGTSLGAGEGDVQAAPCHIQGLTSGTLYHYRVVAVSELEVEGTPTAVSFSGPDQTFTTQGAGGALTLPDARQWELVSPPDKHGALIKPISEANVIQASAGGGEATYVGSLPTEEGVKGYVFNGVQVFSTREAGGWSSQDISLPHATASGVPVGAGHEYRLFSENLSLGLVEPFVAQNSGDFTSLAPEVFPPDTKRHKN